MVVSEWVDQVEEVGGEAERLVRSRCHLPKTEAKLGTVVLHDLLAVSSEFENDFTHDKQFQLQQIGVNVPLVVDVDDFVQLVEVGQEGFVLFELEIQNALHEVLVHEHVVLVGDFPFAHVVHAGPYLHLILIHFLLLRDLFFDDGDHAFLVLRLVYLLYYLAPHWLLDGSRPLPLNDVLDRFLVEVALTCEHLFEEYLENEVDCVAYLLLDAEEFFVALVAEDFEEEEDAVVLLLQMTYAIDQRQRPLDDLWLISVYLIGEVDVQVAFHSLQRLLA